MKIGILTFHYTINQGSVLQAYCVENLLQEQFPGARVEVVNIVPMMREKYELRFVKGNFPFISVKKVQKYRSLRKFVREHLSLSQRVYHNSLEKQIQYINNQKYDLVCTGSDTVWFNSVKLKNLIPNIYFLPNEINSKKISIAASVDPLINEECYTSKHEKLSQIFDDYELITVRDDTTRKLISKFTHNKVEMIADPTILFDFEKKLKLDNSGRKRPFRKKTIGIGITDSKLNEILVKELSTDYQVTNLYDHQSLNFDFIFDELNFYPNFDIIITDRFHISIFSLKLSNALVINVERSNKNKAKNSKGRFLFQNIGLSEYFIRWETSENQLFMDSLKNIISEWDEDSFIKRNEKFQEYIKKEKAIWKRLIQSVKI